MANTQSCSKATVLDVEEKNCLIIQLWTSKHIKHRIKQRIVEWKCERDHPRFNAQVTTVVQVGSTSVETVYAQITPSARTENIYEYMKDRLSCGSLQKKKNK